eukprot:TRINITY_DN23212_c0_g3_i1.p1 TRINITY_DN23212_c0_g3~~TRINITY_DN23212_c0_g3_i1.p1  ORF type:complete len:514 (-),score=133.64 TRINITY_DN23212_c0_g3_i1:37-1578(-)
MSEVYIKEPKTNGKVVLQTTHGDLEIELWATETPKACRNFCQLILEGYYNGTTFHRVIRDFLIQGGDATGTGNGCESIYGNPFPDEIHPRLKFRYRGLLGVASAGKGTKTNGSQFFIAMGRIPTLDGKHTLFGKVVGNTIYNLVRLNEVDVDKHDCPVDPPKIIRADLVEDPFGDLEPRYQQIKAPVSKAPEGHRRAPVKKKNVLSFAGDADADLDSDDEEEAPSSGPAPKSGKSAHDLLNDPKLSKEGAYAQEVAARKQAQGKRSAPDRDSSPADAKRPATTANKAAQGRKTEEKKKPQESEDESEVDYGSDSDSQTRKKETPKEQLQSASRQEAILKLKREIAGLNSGVPDEDAGKKKLGSALEALRKGYQTRAVRAVPRGKEGRRRQAEAVVSNIKSFQERLQNLNDDDESDEEAEDAPERKKEDLGTLAAIWEEGDEESEKGWLKTKGLKFHTSGDKAFEIAARKARSTLEIFDPIAATGNKEVLAEARKRRSSKMIPSMRRNQPMEQW